MAKTSTPPRRSNTDGPREDATLIEVATIHVRGRHLRDAPSERLEWDDTMPGLAVWVRETGARSWVVVRKTIGPPRVDAFGEIFLTDWSPQWKPTPSLSNADCVRKRIAPRLGDIRIDLVTQQDVTDWLADILDPVTAAIRFLVLTVACRGEA